MYRGDIVFCIEVRYCDRNGLKLLDKTFEEYGKAYAYVQKMLDNEKTKDNTYYINEYKQI